MLIGAGADIEAPDGRGMSPLATAIVKRNERIAKYLISRGAQVKSTSFENEIVSPFALAVDHCQAGVAHALAKAGIDVHEKLELRTYTGPAMCFVNRYWRDRSEKDH